MTGIFFLLIFVFFRMRFYLKAHWLGSPIPLILHLFLILLWFWLFWEIKLEWSGSTIGEFWWPSTAVKRSLPTCLGMEALSLLDKFCNWAYLQNFGLLASISNMPTSLPLWLDSCIDFHKLGFLSVAVGPGWRFALKYQLIVRIRFT